MAHAACRPVIAVEKSSSLRRWDNEPISAGMQPAEESYIVKKVKRRDGTEGRQIAAVWTLQYSIRGKNTKSC